MKKIKVLFLIHDLGQGGAEKVLVNLVNHMDPERFDISLTVLFGGGVNEQFLNPNIHFHAVFPRMIPANTKWMKLLTPAQWHKICVRDTYDIEISYLEGVSARVISGCKCPKTALVSWIHVQQHSVQKASKWFRSQKEAERCYGSFDRTVCVSQFVQQDFGGMFALKHPSMVLYNTVESDKILEQSAQPVDEFADDGLLRMIAVGSLKPSKGYDRLLRVVERLVHEVQPVHLYILGIGPSEQKLKQYVQEHDLSNYVTFLGYQLNPYRYVAKSDLLVCASFAEGFSTAATEALIVGTPVCTVDVSGMKEMLGEHNEYGVVTENDENALFAAISQLITDPEQLEHYRKRAKERGADFHTQQTVDEVEQMLIALWKEKQNVSI